MMRVTKIFGVIAAMVALTTLAAACGGSTHDGNWRGEFPREVEAIEAEVAETAQGVRSESEEGQTVTYGLLAEELDAGVHRLVELEAKLPERAGCGTHQRTALAAARGVRRVAEAASTFRQVTPEELEAARAELKKTVADLHSSREFARGC